MSVATPPDLKKLEEMINRFYRVANMNPPRQLNINDGVANVFLTMLHEAEKCTTSMNLVPRPPSGRTTVIWVVSNIGRAFIDSFSEKLSTTCVSGIIYKWQTPLRNASMGI